MRKLPFFNFFSPFTYDKNYRNQPLIFVRKPMINVRRQPILYRSIPVSGRFSDRVRKFALINMHGAYRFEIVFVSRQLQTFVIGGRAASQFRSRFCRIHAETGGYAGRLR